MIFYKRRRKYKYNLHSDLIYETNLDVALASDLGPIEITSTGKLIIRKGYAWDGPSGPTIDTANFMQGSLIHDALYQLMREGILPQQDRKKADQILRQVCLEDGMSEIRAWVIYMGVRLGGASSAKPDMRTAP